jgi:tRNA1Val (adenine37-N6)-methyltransferase
MDSPFRFKQFEVRHDRTSMKVGTDGVLLGAWASVDRQPESILDIGTGTGLIALMLAQRCGAGTIDAIEIDGAAFEQCVENFEASQWADRLFCYHGGFEDFSLEMEEGYDLIVSNPPFYEATVESSHYSRDIARQRKSLPAEILLQGVSRLLEPEGVFSLILPYRQEAAFRELAVGYGLFARRITRVKGNPVAAVKRSLLAFSRSKTAPVEDDLVIETSRHHYTNDYLQLVRDFYLKL